MNRLKPALGCLEKGIRAAFKFGSALLFYGNVDNVDKSRHVIHIFGK